MFTEEIIFYKMFSHCPEPEHAEGPGLYDKRLDRLVGNGDYGNEAT